MATRICPQCGTETQAPFCRVDGFATVDSERYLRRDVFAREGEILAGRYRLDQLHGRTELGSAYRATDLRLQAPVALRLLAPSIATDLGLIARFQREGRLVASLAHPNIVKVTEHGVAEDGTLFIAQELVSGPTLAEALQRTGSFDAPRVVAIGREIFDALSEAHTHGVLHRSLGLDNIVLLTRPGGGETIKISDFGLVHVLADDASQPFVFPQVLTRAWRSMAPEQARGRGVSGHADLYSAGAILYELLTGRPVFGEGTPTDLIVAHSVRLPPPTERDGRLLAGPLVDLIFRCLEKKPWNRPDGAQKALDLLELCRAQPLLPVDPSAAPTAPRPVSKNGKRATNPYGVPVPEGLAAGAARAEAASDQSARTRPGISSPAMELEPAMAAPTDPRGAPRPPGKPTRLRTHSSPGAAPTAPAARPSAPGASAARAESSDRGFASRADLRSGRELDDPYLAEPARSPLLWFVAGVLVAGMIAVLVYVLSGSASRTPERPLEASGPVERPASPATAGTHAGANGSQAAQVLEAPADAASAAAVAPVAPSPAEAPSDHADTRLTPVPDVVVAAPSADAAKAAEETVTEPPAPTVARLEDVTDAAQARPADASVKPRATVASGEARPKVRERSSPKVADPLGDLEDPELAAARKVIDKTMYKVLVDSEPLGAKLSVSGQIVGETPMYVEWTGEGVDVVVTKVGYRPVRQRLVPTTGRSIRIALEPAN